MNRKIPIKNACYDWLTDYIAKPIRKSLVGFIDKGVSLFKTNTPEEYGEKTAYGREEKKTKELKIQKQSEDKIIYFWNRNYIEYDSNSEIKTKTYQ